MGSGFESLAPHHEVFTLGSDIPAWLAACVLAPGPLGAAASTKRTLARILSCSETVDCPT